MATAPTNLLLGALPGPERARLQGAAATVRFGRGDVVHEVGAPVDAVHFPVSGLFTVDLVAVEGSVVEMVPVGAEGVLGLADALAGAPSAHRLTCQVPGEAVRVPAPALLDAFGAPGRLRDLLLGYQRVTVADLSQKVVCGRQHDPDPRCATWLLLADDRAGGGELPLTQALLARALGLRRATVSGSAARLRGAGLIGYRYGSIAVTDRGGLQAAACPCYRVHRDASERFSARVREA